MKIMNARFVRPADEGAIKRVQKATQNGAVTVIHNPEPEVERFMALRAKARSIDTSIQNPVSYNREPVDSKQVAHSKCLESHAHVVC